MMKYLATFAKSLAAMALIFAGGAVALVPALYAARLAGETGFPDFSVGRHEGTHLYKRGKFG